MSKHLLLPQPPLTPEQISLGKDVEIRRLNDVLAALTLRWSHVAPKEVGYYWYKRKCDSYDVIEIVEVRDRGYLYAGNHGPVMQLRGEWAGPLPIPLEAPQ